MLTGSGPDVRCRVVYRCLSTLVIQYSAGCGSVVPKRALTAYRYLPKAATVVGTSKLGSVIVPTFVPEANPRSSWRTAISLTGSAPRTAFYRAAKAGRRR